MSRLICILMDFDIHIDTLSMGLPTCILRYHRQNFLEHDIFLSLNVCLYISKLTVIKCTMCYAELHLGHHCLTSASFELSSIQQVKGNNVHAHSPCLSSF